MKDEKELFRGRPGLMWIDYICRQGENKGEELNATKGRLAGTDWGLPMLKGTTVKDKEEEEGWNRNEYLYINDIKK